MRAPLHGWSACVIGVLLGGCSPEPLDDEFEDFSEEDQALGAVTPGSGWKYGGQRWTDGVVTYLIDKSGTAAQAFCSKAYGQPMSDEQIASIHQGLKEYESLIPVRFQEWDERNPARPDSAYIIYTSPKPSKNKKTLGRFTSSAEVRGMPENGAPDCVYIRPASSLTSKTLLSTEDRRRSVLHETGHALGFDHEQQRSDRDTYLYFDNICLSANNQLPDNKLFGIDTMGTLVGPYDYDSIMQYDSPSGCTCKLGKVCQRPTMLKRIACSPQVPVGPPTEGDCRWISTPTDLSVEDVNGFTRAYERALGHNRAGDRFGETVVTADFDGDGYLDLAVGAPSEGGTTVKGGVFLFKGTGGAVRGELGRLVAWKRLSPADFTLADGGHFGAALAAGDFNGDNVTDLAVGAPDGQAGTVYLYRSHLAHFSDNARTFEPWQAITESALGLPQEDGDRFGAALIAARLGTTRLVIGAPGARVASSGVNAGQVVVVQDLHTLEVLATLAPHSVRGAADLAGARFGASLAVGDFDLDGNLDLAIGSPESATPSGNGAVYLMRGSPPSVRASLSGMQVLRPLVDQIGIGFGEALAAGAFGGSDTSYLAVGAPRFSELVPGDHAGRIFVYAKLPARSPPRFPMEEVQQLSTGAGDGLGQVLLTLHHPLGSDELDAGLPEHHGGVGAVVNYRQGAAGLLQATGTIEGVCGANGRFGGALATGAFNQPERLSGQLVVGCAGDDPGGTVKVRRIPTELSLPWDTFTQETANPE